MSYDIDRIAIIDVETTGLMSDPIPPALLEVAAIMVSRDLEVIGYTNGIVDAKLPLKIGAIVNEMHTRNRLFDDIRKGLGSTLKDTEDLLVDFVVETTSGVPTPLIWCGASPWSLDRPILQRDMPNFYRMFSYRTIDVTSLLIAMNNWDEHGRSKIDLGNGSDHRAMNDCMDVLNRLRKIREHLSMRTS